MDRLKTYVFDIDGTVCTNTYGDYQSAEPLVDRIAIVNSLYDQGHTIFMLTARGMGRTNNNQLKAADILYEFTEKQLKSWGLNFHKLFLGKPSGDYYIDDKGINDVEFFV
jgi:hypothetical protein